MKSANRYLIQLKLAIKDLSASIRHYDLFSYFAWIDIQQRYRGSVLGPFWITLSMAIFVVALSLVYSQLLHTDLNNLVPYLTAGMLVWNFITTAIVDSADTFTANKSLIDNMKLPYLIYVFRIVFRNVIIFFHNFVVFVIVALLFKIPITLSTLFFIPALLLSIIMLMSLCTIFSLLGTRFRDLPPLISNFVALLFFVSPVVWERSMLGENSWIVTLNPAFYFLDLLRTPLLGQAPQLSSWIIGSILTVILFLGGFFLFTRVRSRIPFWI